MKVENTCKGLTKDQSEKIFDRFYRNDKARSREEGNHGLGLSIAKTIINGHGGKLTCDSILGVNVTFKLILKNK